MSVHRIKISAQYFDLVLCGAKKAEYRKNDRDYKKGDRVIMLEVEHGVFTGRALTTSITDVTDLSPVGNKEYVMFSVSQPSFTCAELVKGVVAQ